MFSRASDRILQSSPIDVILVLLEVVWLLSGIDSNTCWANSGVSENGSLSAYWSWCGTWQGWPFNQLAWFCLVVRHSGGLPSSLLRRRGSRSKFWWNEEGRLHRRTAAGDTQQVAVWRGIGSLRNYRVLGFLCSTSFAEIKLFWKKIKCRLSEYFLLSFI